MTPKPSTAPLAELVWLKSSYSSSGDGESCVEIATTSGTVHVRDSKYRKASPSLALAPEAWADFVTYVSES
jgi:hypothetical protein